MPLNFTSLPNRNNITLSSDSKLSFQLILYADIHMHIITQVHFIQKVYVNKMLKVTVVILKAGYSTICIFSISSLCLQQCYNETT